MQLGSRGVAARVCAGVALICLASCTANGPLSRLGRQTSPYERYLATLRQAGLDQTALGRDWVRAGETSLAHPVLATLPFRETGYFSPDSPAAAAYRMELRRGRQLAVDVAFESAEPARVFVDLFELNADAPPRRVAALSPDARTLSFDVDRDGTYVLRIQPELLRSGRYTLVQRTLSSLVFPVPGLSARAIQSQFGAARAAGTREHEGVDIFADRGTPVVAVADGVAQRGTNGLGGNVVWLQPHTRDGTFYYAHLERWAIDGTATVRAGDVLGYVGNTGNARTTAPHLHFGIYARGAIDPLPFLQPDDDVPPEPRAALDRLGHLVRVVPVRTALRDAADAGSATRAHLPRASLARVAGAARASYRVMLPDARTGYVEAATVTLAATRLRRERLPAGTTLRERPTDTSPVVEVLAAVEEVDVIGQFDRFTLVRLPAGRTAWVNATPESLTSS